MAKVNGVYGPHTPETGDQGGRGPRARVPLIEGRGVGVIGSIQGQGEVEGQDAVQGQNAIQGQRDAQAYGVSSTGDHSLIPAELVNIGQDSASARTVADKKIDGGKTSPLDKDLPSKPSLRSTYSPERRGVFDATDSAIKALNDTYPALAPERPMQHPPRIPVVRRSASATQVARNGSPMARKYFPLNKPTMNGYSPRARNGVGPTLRVAKDADEVIMGRNNIGHASGKGAAHRSRQPTPGEHRLSQVGIVVNTYPPRTSSLPNTPEATTKDLKAPPPPSVVHRLSRPTQASTQRAAEAMSTILERGQMVAQKKYNAISVAGSPALPTIRATSATLSKSTTTFTLKKTGQGIRSAMSAFLPGRRRTESYKKPKDSDIIEPVKTEAETTKPEAEVPKKSSFNCLPHASARSVSFADATFPNLNPEDNTQQGIHAHTARPPRHLTNFENSGVNDSADTHNWKKKPTDKMAGKDSTQARETETVSMTEAHATLNREATRSNQAPTGSGWNGNNDGEDPTHPRNTGNNPAHYNEEQLESGQQTTTKLAPDRFNDTIESVTAFFDNNLRNTENCLFRIMTQINAVPNSPLRIQMLAVVAALENSIRVTRQARMANICLHENVALLVSQTVGFADDAARIVEGDRFR